MNEKDLLIKIIQEKGMIIESLFSSSEEMKNFMEKYSFTEAFKNEDANQILGKCTDILSDQYGIEIPQLSDDEKKAAIIAELKKLGLSDSSLQNIGLDNINSFIQDEKQISFTLEDTPENRKILDKEAIEYQKESENLRITARLKFQEEYEIPDTKENRRILTDNDIEYFKKADNKLRFSMGKKKMIAFVALNFLVSPVIAIALFFYLNKKSYLDKLLAGKEISKEQRKALMKGYAIRFTKNINGKKIDYYRQLDKATGSMISIPAGELRIPKNKLGVQLSPIEAKRIHQGEAVSVKDRHGVEMVFRVDLNEKDGIGAWYKEGNNRENNKVPTVDSTDKEKLSYIAARGGQAIADIFGDKKYDETREKFLDKYRLVRDYKDILSLQEEFKKEKDPEKAKEILRRAGVVSDRIRMTAGSHMEELKVESEKTNSFKR